MTRGFEGPRRAGGAWIGAVVETSVHVASQGGGLQGTGSKHPLAFLIHDGRMLSVFDAEGGPITEAHADRLCPGSVQRMLSAAAGEG